MSTANYSDYQQQYRESHRQERRAASRSYYADNKDKMRACEQAWYGKNRDRVLARKRELYALNKQIRLPQMRAWQAANPDKIKLYRRVNEQNRRSAEGRFTAADWRFLMARSRRCFWCRRPFNHRRKKTHDHVIALANGGTNSLINSVCACSDCNIRKGARPFDPVSGQGILL